MKKILLIPLLFSAPLFAANPTIASVTGILIQPWNGDENTERDTSYIKAGTPGKGPVVKFLHDDDMDERIKALKPTDIFLQKSDQESEEKLEYTGKTPLIVPVAPDVLLYIRKMKDKKSKCFPVIGNAKRLRTITLPNGDSRKYEIYIVEGLGEICRDTLESIIAGRHNQYTPIATDTIADTE